MFTFDNDSVFDAEIFATPLEEKSEVDAHVADFECLVITGLDFANFVF